MILVTTHIGADFDAFASMLAASKLYPGAVCSFSGSASRNVREFLGKHSSIRVLTPRRVNLQSVSKLVVVDTSLASRLGPFAELVGKVEIHVYDHHPPTPSDLRGDFSLRKEVGSTTTLMVEILRERGIEITPMEATIFAMGIYEDTSFYTSSATTREDLEALAFLIERGADLPSIPEHVDLYLKPEERALLDQMASRAEVIQYKGSRIVVSRARCSFYTEGISLFAHKLRDFLGADVVLAEVEMGDRRYVVGRSRRRDVDLGKLFKLIGGGGHPQAASAVVREKGSDPLGLILKKVKELISRGWTVGKFMSSPVMAISPDHTVEEVHRLALRFSHSAFPVVEGNNRVVGIITRKAIDKAMLFGLRENKVKEFMTRKVICAKPNYSIDKALELLALNSIGRLPVVNYRGELVGIITRTDLLKAIYFSDKHADWESYRASLTAKAKEEALLPWEEEVSNLMESVLPSSALKVLRFLGRRADELGMEAYAVGGFVRDLLLGRYNPDLDVVIVGDGVKYLEHLASRGFKVSVHKRFKTGVISLGRDLKVDVATARKEYYEVPAGDPHVEETSLKHDLYRRDFTINAMAIRVSEKGFGVLTDYFGGRRDLIRKQIRVLHNLSFVEDPTRIIRAIRLESKLGFIIEEDTLNLMMEAIRGGLVRRVGPLRIRSELETIFAESYPHRAIERLSELGILSAIFDGYVMSERERIYLRRMWNLLRFLGPHLEDVREDAVLGYLAVMFVERDRSMAELACRAIKLSERESSRFLSVLGEAPRVCESILDLAQGAEEVPPSRVASVLDGFDPLAVLVACAVGDSVCRRKIMEYLRFHRSVRPAVSGEEVISLGLKRGPAVGEVLKRLRYLVMDRPDMEKEEQLALARELIRQVELETKDQARIGRRER